MYRIGLTGGIASGKTTVCQYFMAFGVDIYDADVIARDLVKTGTPCYQEILAQFGSAFLSTDGALDRAKLRKRIFSDEKAKRTLENILHPAIQAVLVSQSALSESPYCLLAIPLLAESRIIYPLDRTLVIDIPQAQQLQRLCERDGLPIALAEAMIEQQASRADRLAIADDIIRNESDLGSLKKRVSELHQSYLTLANHAAKVAS